MLEQEDKEFLCQMLLCIEEVLEPHREAETKEAWKIIKDYIENAPYMNYEGNVVDRDEADLNPPEEEDCPGNWWVCHDEDVFPETILADENNAFYAGESRITFGGDEPKDIPLVKWFKSLFKFPYD